MLNFIETNHDDVAQLQRWIAADVWHAGKNLPCEDAAFWLTGAKGSYLASKLVDESGTVLFFKFDRESSNTVRLHTQFAPVDLVSEKRVARAIIEGLSRFSAQAKMDGFTEIITESVSPKLIHFLKKIGFVSVGGDDYACAFAASQGVAA